MAHGRARYRTTLFAAAFLRSHAHYSLKSHSYGRPESIDSQHALLDVDTNFVHATLLFASRSKVYAPAQ